VLCFFLLPIANGCSPPLHHPGILIVAKPGDAVKLDPADITDSQSAQVTENIFDTLVEYRDGSTAIQPALAESWEMSKDGKTWIFHLRHGVRFHDGTPFNADAVVFNFDRQMNLKNRYHADGQFIYWQTMWGGYPGRIDRIKALDPYRITIHLTEPVAPFLANLAMFPFAISSPSAIRKWGADYFKHPVGTGPFRFALWEEKERIILEANPDYWGGAPKIERLVFQPIADDTSRRLELERGTIDFMVAPHPDDVKTLETDPGITVLKAPGMNVAYLAMNCQKPPFDKVSIRQAIRYAINKPRIIRELYQGLAIPAVNPMPPMMLGYAKALRDYPYDPEKAKKLLRDNGFPNGFRTALWYLPINRDYMPEPKAVAEAIQSDLHGVGIEANLLTFDWGTYLDKVSMGEHAMALFGWVGDNGDPDNFLYALLDKDNAKKPAQNVAFYANEQVHNFLTKAEQVEDSPSRAMFFDKAERIIYEESPWVPIAHAEQVAAFKKEIQGFELHPTGMLRFRNVVMLPKAEKN